jgi:excinuclease ABC subunit C
MSTFPWPPARLEDLPERPGVYLFRDAKGGVVYVGKSRQLRARLATYRAGGDGRINLRFLERSAKSVETVVTRSEGEALLLEDELIKRHQPPHNVRLKDNKSFLMIRVDLEEPFPRLKFVRAHRPRAGKGTGRSRLFGPYPSARSVRRAIADLHRLVPLRDCTDQVMAHRTRPCLKHQLGLCAAPCVGLIDAPAYAEHVERALAVLAGDVEALRADLEVRMRAASERQEYELAAGFRDRLAALHRSVEGQGVLSNERTDRDVLALARSGDRVQVHRLVIRRGKLSESRGFELRSELPDAECLHGLLTHLYLQAGSERPREIPKEIIVPLQPAEAEVFETWLAGSQLLVPRGGERARQLELARENALLELARAEAAEAAGGEAEGAVARLLGLKTASGEPLVIDCFDVSNFQGAHVVASRVRFRGGHPDRAGYRRYRVRSVSGQDDFQAMQEVVGRSLRRGLDEGELPDLVVIDGGAAQLARAWQARDEAGAWDVRIVALAKARAERTVRGAKKQASEERLYLAPERMPLVLERHTSTRHLFERLRDEAHRFAITYHRKERGRLRSRLDSIAGLGAVRKKALLTRFGSVQGVAQASLAELEAVPGISARLARTIFDDLRREG